MSFIDMPRETYLRRALRSWVRPPLLPEPHAALEGLFHWGKAPVEDRDETVALDWLYAFIRLNVKRGPVFDLNQALHFRRADCLAYCKLFTLLGRRMGMNTGVVDMIIDSGGRYVPHTCIMVKTAGGRPRFVDLWYGSREIRHRRICVRVKEGRRWAVMDVDYPQLEEREVDYIPDTYIDGITCYVLGNRHLNRGELPQSIDCYTRALELYPESIRPFYNRAIAHEGLGELRKAQADYEAAFTGEDALIRTMAREHEEITDLMRLDEAGIDEEHQQMYLLRKGIITGRAVPLSRIARLFALPEDRLRAILSAVEKRVARSAT